MSAYQRFYTEQEREDALAARIDNPNRVGTGFINLGPMERQSTAANWQTSSLLGGGAAAPPNVSEIWKQPAAPVPPPQQRVQPPPPPPPQLVQSQMGMQQAFAPPVQPPKEVGAIFQSLSIDAPSQPTCHQSAFLGGGGSGAPFGCMNSVNKLTATSVQQPFMNGAPAATQQQQQTQSLMSLLHTPATSATLNPVFALGNGTVPQAACTTRAQAAFSHPVPPAPHCQLPSGAHSNAFASSAFAPSTSRQPPPPPPPPPQPKALQSPADYAAAALTWKPPVATSRGGQASSAAPHSVARKPEKSKAPPQAPPAAKEEWECPRCTFLNNRLLNECEMCGSERPGGKAAEQPSSSVREQGESEEGWRTALSAAARKATPASGAAVSGKSKAQAKNEKRRAKKRGE